MWQQPSIAASTPRAVIYIAAGKNLLLLASERCLRSQGARYDAGRLFAVLEPAKPSMSDWHRICHWRIYEGQTSRRTVVAIPRT